MPKKRKTALITGITGQDGSYLAEFLLEQGYRVVGMVRRTSTINFDRIKHIQDKIELAQGDLLDQMSLVDILKEYRPDEVYNLAAQSFVPTSWKQPVLTGEFTALGVTRLLEAIRLVKPDTRFYQASSSVDGKTPVLVRCNGEVKLIAIEELVPPEHKEDNVRLPLQGVEILSVDDQYRVTFMPVSHVVRHLKDRIYTVKYKGGGEIRITGDHSVIVFGPGGELVEKRVDELQVGDYLITYNGSHVGQLMQADVPTNLDVRPEYRTRVNGYREKVPVTPDLMRLLGYYLAEGHCDLEPSRRLYMVTFTFHVNEVDRAQDTVNIVKKLFPELTVSETAVPERNIRMITVSGKMFASLCAQFGKTALQKHLPAWIWELAPPLIHEFMKGYLGDARVTEREIAYTTGSERLAHELVYLMRNAGLGCRLYSRVNPPRLSPQGTVIPEATAYDVKLSSRYMRHLLDDVEHETDWQQSSLECLPSFLFREAMEGICYHHIKYKPLVSKQKLKRLIQEYNLTLPEPLDRLVHSNLAVAKITDIRCERGRFHVYDVSVPEGQRFFGGNIPILLHNSEMFGKVREVPQNEKTPFYPRSPYGVAKVYGHWITVNYRESYGLFAVSGILFNHECVTAETPVIVRHNGVVDVVPIGDIRRPREKGASKQTFDVSDMNLEVWDGDRFVKVTTITATRHHPEKEDKGVTMVVARRGAFAATSDHVVIMEGGEKPVQEIEEGDRVSLVGLPEPPGLASVTPEEALLLGMFVADGSVYESEGHLRARFTNRDPELLKMFAELWHKVTLGYTTEGRSTSGYTGERDVPYLSLNGAPEYVAWLYRHCYTCDRHKKIPARILNADVEIWREFLRGYNLCDGLKGGYGDYEFKNFKTNSPALALGLWWLAQKALGQPLTLSVEERNGRFYYSLNLRSPNPVGEKGQHLAKAPNEVKKRIPLKYEGWLFDLATESGTFHAGVGQCHIHNSPRRGLEFVTHKITYGAAKIKMGLADELRLGNLEARRDWGYAKDYVRAMWLMLQQDEPEDYVIATGETHSVREFAQLAFDYLGLNYEDYVVVDPAFFRPAEVDLLVGDASKAREKLGWEPEVSFEELVRIMVEADLEALRQGIRYPELYETTSSRWPAKLEGGDDDE